MGSLESNAQLSVVSLSRERDRYAYIGSTSSCSRAYKLGRYLTHKSPSFGDDIKLDWIRFGFFGLLPSYFRFPFQSFPLSSLLYFLLQLSSKGESPRSWSCYLVLALVRATSCSRTDLQTNFLLTSLVRFKFGAKRLSATNPRDVAYFSPHLPWSRVGQRHLLVAVRSFVGIVVCVTP